jgi:hypothetical protein
MEIGFAAQSTTAADDDEDVEPVEAVQCGLRTTGYRCGPLNEREAAIGWLADRVRTDIAAGAASP